MAASLHAIDTRHGGATGIPVDQLRAKHVHSSRSGQQLSCLSLQMGSIPTAGGWLLSFPAGLMTGGSWTTRWQQEYKCQCCHSWEPELLSLWNLHCVGENTNFLQETRPTRILAKLFPDGEKLPRKQVVVSPSEMEWILWFHPGPCCRASHSILSQGSPSL